MAILLIRHGETLGNRDRVMQLPETPLSERGISQASRLAERLAGREIGQILSSDHVRAHMTAEAVSRATGIPVEIEPLLQERNFGDLRGRRYADLDDDPFGPEYSPPGGESWPEFHSRVDRAWSRVLGASQSTEKNLAVVTHGLVLHSIALHHIRLPAEALPEEGSPLPIQFGNTALTVVESGEFHPVSLLGCTAHLEDCDASEGLSGI